MVSANANISRVCSFYVSDWHFITMLLPHINKKIDEGAKITTILEEDAQERVETLLKKLKLENTKKIIDIDWRKKDIDYANIKKVFNTKRQDKEIIVSGTVEYINRVNNIIEEYVSQNKIKDEIKIINCYYVTDNLNINEILDYHKAVLNTAGEKSVKDFKRSISMM